MISLKKLVSAQIILGVFLWVGCVNRQKREPPRSLPADVLLRIDSAVGGWRSPSPKWSSDGLQIIFESSLNRGGLSSLYAEGGFPRRLAAYLGETGYFHSYHDPRISPDGKWIAYISTNSGAREIWIGSMSDHYSVQLTSQGSRIGAPNWSPDSRWIAFANDTQGNYDIWRVAVPWGEVQQLTSDERQEVNPAWTPDSTRIVYVRLNEQWNDHDIMGITAEGKNPRIVITDTDFYDNRSGQEFGYPQVSPDGHFVLFRSYRSGWKNYWLVPLEGGEPRQVASEDADQHEARWAPDGKLIVYTSNHKGCHDLRVVDAAGGTPRVLMAPDMGVCANPEWSPDGTRISFTFTTPTRPKDLFIVTLSSGEIRQLTHSLTPNLEERLVKPEKITYPSADGPTVHGYLYKPPGIRSSERLPGIVWIHGGPTAQYEDAFQYQPQSAQPGVQFIVQHGYVVLQPNIRGSSGYGREFQKANVGCWGECDLKDVLEGAEYLKSLSYVNPDKIAVTGRAFGGILSLYAVAHAPGAFQAAVAESSYYDYELGGKEDNEDLKKKLFAIDRVDKIITPLLIVHGEQSGPDRKESGLFVEELRKFNKNFEYKTYPGEIYYVFGLENQRQMLLDKLVFYDKYLKGGDVTRE
ncbi:MAG: hypothetical protein A2W25_11540 [candidate division Zixibacteria bacterium RBG_16_53_22]|nr:MAG: hypothetical protein A2W25_11540 [candidate division Zixibacteria bacterium RBG_16_53_22]